uniref:Uncharacterized protein n=1 Tax=Pristionchus pacificus TaxID=54126 RepID=A0A2A6CCV2_PRIPA|eukprot:PDM76024.1 hypothetical protein PRIPAC_39628 [Pristionchus pacificus]
MLPYLQGTLVCTYPKRWMPVSCMFTESTRAISGKMLCGMSFTLPSNSHIFGGYSPGPQFSIPGSGLLGSLVFIRSTGPTPSSWVYIFTGSHPSPAPHSPAFTATLVFILHTWQFCLAFESRRKSKPTAAREEGEAAGSRS